MDHVEVLRAALSDPRVVLERLGLLRKKASPLRGGFKIQCPWHPDRNPSCSVQRKDGAILAHCHSCKNGGDVFSLIAAARNISGFPNILVAAAELAGRWDIVESIQGTRRSPGAWPAFPPIVPSHQDATFKDDPESLDDDTFDRVVDHLRRLCPLDTSPEAVEYLNGRALLDEALSAGWWALPAPSKQTPVVEELHTTFGERTLRLSGLFQRKGALRFVFSDNRLCIPWHAPGINGSVLTIQRRLLRSPNPKEQKYVFATARKARWPFFVPLDIEDTNPWKSSTEDNSFAVVWTEGAVDCLAMRAHCRNLGLEALVFGVPGVSNWKDDWSRFASGRITYIAFDADAAGDNTKAICQSLWNGGAIDVKRLRPRNAKDWAEVKP